MLRIKSQYLFTIFILLVLFSCKKAEPKEQWISLFNGKNLDGWHVKINGFELGDNAFNTFRVRNNSIVVNYDNYSNFKDYYGHIFYKDSFSNYRLKFQRVIRTLGLRKIIQMLCRSCYADSKTFTNI